MTTALATVTSDTRAACRVRLAAVSGLPALSAWALEGQTFTPPASGAWLRETLTPVTMDARTVGVGRRVECVALYTVALFLPAATASTPGAGADSPTKRADTLADAVCAAFEPGVTFPAPSGRLVRVRQVRRGPLLPDAPWLQAPVLVTCTADAVTAS